jgi:hypothetical protein
LGVRGLGLARPSYTRFKRRKLGIYPTPPEISAISKPVFFSPQNVAISKLFFFPSWKCGDLVSFLEIFQNACFTMYVFMRDFSKDFRHKK